MIKKISPSTKNTIHSALTTFFDYLKKRGKIQENYAEQYGAFKTEVSNDSEIKIRYQTLEQFNLFISVVDDEFWNMIFNFAFWHGNRKGEQRALYIEDINFNFDTVNFNKTFTRDKDGHGVVSDTTKNGKCGKTYLAPCCKEQLKKHVTFMKSLPGYNKKWFLFGGDKPLSRNSFDRKLKYYYKKTKRKIP